MCISNPLQKIGAAATGGMAGLIASSVMGKKKKRPEEQRIITTPGVVGAGPTSGSY